MDVDDTTRCPLGAACESCEGAGNLLVHTADTPAGVLSMTLCEACVTAEPPRLPRPPSWSVAIYRVGAHCMHLGCTVDDMGAAIAKARGTTEGGG